MYRPSSAIVLVAGLTLGLLGCREGSNPVESSPPDFPGGGLSADFTTQGGPGWTKPPEPVFTPSPADYYAPSLDEAKDARTVVAVHVGISRGKTLETRLEESSGNPALDDAALRVLRDFEWEPGYIGDAPVAGWLQIPFEIRANR